MGDVIPVAGVILHRDCKVLLQHRDDKPDIVYPNTWAIFGGHLDPGEDPESGARREIEEELGLRLEGPLELVFNESDGSRHRYFYAAELTVPLEALTLMEGQGLGLFSEEELDGVPVVPLHARIVRDFLAQQRAR